MGVAGSGQCKYQAAQTLVETSPRVSARAVEWKGKSATGRKRSAPLARFEDDAELGRDDAVAPATFDGLAQQLFVVAAAVKVGRVNETDAQVERVTQRANSRRFVRRAVITFQPHRAVADGADLQSLLSECALGDHGSFDVWKINGPARKRLFRATPPGCFSSGRPARFLAAV
jgi:hypothetical protein